MNSKPFLLIPIFLFLANPSYSIDYFNPPTVFTNNPKETFNHQKSWFYYSKDKNSYVYQAYLPGFTEDQISVKIVKRLAGGYQLDVNASRWDEVYHRYTPSKVLKTFSESVNLPIDTDQKNIKSGFNDQIMSIKFPKI